MSALTLRDSGDPGLFGPGSMSWELCRERAIAAMAPRAVLLQYAHPAFAAASHAYAVSGRFERALRTLSEVVFAERPIALAHARRVQQMHARLQGRTEQGVPWSATDPLALAWVLVTLIDATVRGAELVRGRLPDDQVALFLGEAQAFGRLFGVREEDVPEDRRALEARIEEAVRHTLVVGPEVRETWRYLLSGAGVYRPLLARWIGSTLPRELALALGAPRLPWPLLQGARAGFALGRLAPERIRFLALYRARARARARARETL